MPAVARVRVGLGLVGYEVVKKQILEENGRGICIVDTLNWM